MNTEQQPQEEKVEGSTSMREANTQEKVEQAQPPQAILDRWEKWKAMGSPKIQDANPDMVNVFVCGDGHETVTRDTRKGVTPALIPCLHPGCKLDAISARYMVPDAKELLEKGGKWVYRWVRPNVQHVPTNDFKWWQQGGLLLMYGINSTLVWDNGKRYTQQQAQQAARRTVEVKDKFRRNMKRALIDTIKAHKDKGEEPPMPAPEKGDEAVK